MRIKTITVTEAARNFSDCINRANYQETTFVLLKNGSPVARIVPDREKKCAGRDLAATLKANPLDAKEARAWKRDLNAARKKLISPADKWRQFSTRMSSSAVKMVRSTPPPGCYDFRKNNSNFQPEGFAAMV